MLTLPVTDEGGTIYLFIFFGHGASTQWTRGQRGASAGQELTRP